MKAKYDVAQHIYAARLEESRILKDAIRARHQIALLKAELQPMIDAQKRAPPPEEAEVAEPDKNTQPEEEQVVLPRVRERDEPPTEAEPEMPVFSGKGTKKDLLTLRRFRKEQ